MIDFWDRKRQELYPQRALEVQRSEPWWQRNTVPQKLVTPPVQPGQQQLDLGYVDGHDVSKADILKGNAEECPRCPRDPRSGIAGNMYRPSRNAAMRCFDCGFIDGRDMGEGQSRIATVQGATQTAKQTASGGAVVGNFHGNITSVHEAVGRIR